MKCKDCIHYEVCKALDEGGQAPILTPDTCGCFKLENDINASSTIKELKYELSNYRHAMCMIAEICVDESKRHILPEDAIERIRKNIYWTSSVEWLRMMGDYE